MLRGFRWQLLALLTAAVLFGISLFLRVSETPPPIPDNAPTVTAVPGATELPPTEQQVVNVEIQQMPPPGSDRLVTYTEALVGSPQRLNPLFASLNPVDQDITSLIFEGLTRSNQYGEPEPALAKSWVISSDGLEYIVHLREDVLWQDGVPFDADDVIYTMAILRSPDFPGSAELGAFWRTVETEKLGEHLIRFRLTQRLGSFLNMLRIGILPVHALEGTEAAQIATHPFNLTPIGTGPYQLEALRGSGSEIEAVDLRVAPVYRQRPEGQQGYALDRVRFHFYETFDDAKQALAEGEVDGLFGRERGERLPLLSVQGVDAHTAIQPELGAIIFNWANDNTAFFREQRVRVALEVGLDRSSVVERNLLNQAVRADSPIMPGSWAFVSDLPWPQHDPAGTRDLLSTAYERFIEMQERTDAAETTPEATAEATAEASAALFEFEILTPDDAALVQMAQEIATQWAQYGLGVSVTPADTETYQARLDAGDFEAALVELSLGDSADPDVYEFWHQGQYPDGKNYGDVTDRRISELLERARQDVSGVNRAEFYRLFQQEFVERAIAIPMYYPLYTYATTDEVDGVQLGFIGTPSDRFRNIQNWTKNEPETN